MLWVYAFACRPLLFAVWRGASSRLGKRSVSLGIGMITDEQKLDWE